jgi:hypothetical protein
MFSSNLTSILNDFLFRFDFENIIHCNRIVLYFGMPETKGVPLEDVGKLFETEEEKALREESSRSGGKKI